MAINSELHVVLGSGMVGTKLARRLGDAGKQVLLLSRTATGPDLPNVSRRAADAGSFSSLDAVAPKASHIYNCVNPPYTKWEIEWPRINKAVNEYAMRTGAVLVTSSNLYGYGPQKKVLTEDLPLLSQWRNGRVRAEMWLEVKDLHDAGKMRATEVRASDYICASDQSRMGDRVVPQLMKGKRVQLLGALDKLHTWTDPDDVAELMAVVAEDERAWGLPWHVPSNEPKTQLQVVNDIAQELGIKEARVSSVSPFMEKMIGRLNPVVRELANTNYQFNNTFIMSDERARATFGLRQKPWKRVIEDLVAGYRK